MVSISPEGRFNFSVAATSVIKEKKAKRLLLMWDAGRRRIGFAVAKENSPHSYAVIYYAAKDVCQIRVRPFPRHVGTLLGSTFRVDLKQQPGEVFLEGTIAKEHFGVKPEP
jgi:hypothetical protein